MMQNTRNIETLQMGTPLRVLSELYPINTNITGFNRFSKLFASLCFWTKVASALEGFVIDCSPGHQSVTKAFIN